MLFSTKMKKYYVTKFLLVSVNADLRDVMEFRGGRLFIEQLDYVMLSVVCLRV